LSRRSCQQESPFFVAIDVRAHIGAKFRPSSDGLFSLRSSGYQRSRHLASRSEFCVSDAIVEPPLRTGLLVGKLVETNIVEAFLRE